MSDENKTIWYNHWVKKGLASLEKRLAKDARVGQFCYGDKPSMADVFLVPQVFNAYDAKIDFSVYPTVHRIVTHCMTLPVFMRLEEKQCALLGKDPLTIRDGLKYPFYYLQDQILLMKPILTPFGGYYSNRVPGLTQKSESGPPGGIHASNLYAFRSYRHPS